MNYENLKSAIVAVIKQNGNEEITGDILQQVLVAMVNSLGSGYQFRGIATPETNPGTPDQRVFYLASVTGAYPDFGLNVSDEICALVYGYSAGWYKQTIIALDQKPTENSGNLISSGAIYTALQNLADTYMQLVKSAEENHLASFDGDGQVKDAGIGLDGLALPAGHYPDLFAGFAGNLVDTRSAGTRQQFAYRQSGGDGVNYMRKILGRTEAFNQLVYNVNAASEVYGITRTKVNNYTLRYYGTCTNTTNFTGTTGIDIIAGHKYLALAQGLPASCSIRFVGDGPTGVPYFIYDATTTITTNIDIIIPSGTTIDANISFICIDLTLEGLGLTTADQFRALHPLGHYSPASKLINNAAMGLETVGVNQYNPTTGTAQVIAGQTYYIGGTYTSISQDGETITPENHLFTPANTGEVVVVGGNDTDTIINRSDASRNGIYEPYWKREIVLGLDNLACHDEQGNAVVVNGLDGVGTVQDELIVENGWGTKIIKRFTERDLGDLVWKYESEFGGFVGNFGPLAKVAYKAICSKYPYMGVYRLVNDKECGYIYERQLFVKDSAYGTDAAAFKAAVAGVKFRLEANTLKVLTLDNPIPALIEVDNLGTEKRLPEDTADNPQGPFECDSNYSISTANLVRKLSQ